MPHKTTVFFNRNCHDYGAQDTALRQRGEIVAMQLMKGTLKKQMLK